jgi:hypothetical protein
MEKSNPFIENYMKTYLTLFFIALVFAASGHAGTGCESASPTNTIQKKQHLFSSYVSWELQLGGSFLTNTKVSANRPLADSKTMSGSFFTSLIIPLGKKEECPWAHFAAHIGIGTIIQTLGLNKLIENVNNTAVFVDFPNNNIRYSYLQQIFISAPVGFSHRPCKNLELELDGIVGYMVYKEHSFYTAETHGYSIQSTEHILNLNPFQYGLRGKINLIHFLAGHPFGCMYSISGNYYFSEVFKSVNGSPTKNFSLLLGIGFFIHR